MPRVFVNYADLLSDWRKSVNKIGKRLKVPISLSPEKISAVSEFLEDDLRHDRLTTTVSPDDGITRMALAVHAAFTLLSKNAEDRAARIELDNLRKDFNRLRPVDEPLI